MSQDADHLSAPRQMSRRWLLSAAVAGGAASLVGASHEKPAVSRATPEVLTVPPDTTARFADLLKFRRYDTVRQASQYDRIKPTVWGPGVHGVMSSFQTRSRQIALTLDACGGPRGSGCDRRIISALQRERVPATLFLNSRWIQANRAIADELASDPLFTLGNHGTRHVPLSVSGRAAYGITGTRSVSEAIDEVWGCHQLLTRITGREPQFFRPGTAFYDDVAIRIVTDLGELPIGYSVNGDSGATLNPGQVVAKLSNPRRGAIILAHVNQPNRGSGVGLVSGIRALRSRGWEFVSLHDKQLVTA